MYPSNYANEDTTSLLFSDTNINSTYSIEDFSSSSNLLFNYFPYSPHINYDDSMAVFDQHLHDIVIHQNSDDQEMVATDQNSNGKMHRNNNVDEFSFQNSNVKKSSSGGNNNCRQQIKVNRRCKKDRHSKIITSNGSSRGRRMRLSIDVAKEFFALQDMLKFDKASKTVEWLLIKSKTAINEEVTKNGIIGTKHSSSPSTSILSAVDELGSKVMMKENMNQEKGARKLATFHPLTRELRDKARARARERTQEKKRLQLCEYNNINDQSKIYNSSQELTFRSHNHLLCWEKSASAACSNILKTNTSTHPTVLEMQELLNYSKQSPQNIEGTIFQEQLIIDDSSFFMTNNWNPNTMNNHHRNPGTTSTENEFTQFQYDGKPWKEYNST